MTSLRNKLIAHAEEYYGTSPEYLWAKTPNNAILRHPNNKWYAALLEVHRSKLGLEGDAMAHIVNVKCDPLLIGSLRQQPGILPAYHMNKEQWISILLDDTVALEQILLLLEMSYDIVGKQTKKKIRKP